MTKSRKYAVLAILVGSLALGVTILAQVKDQDSDQPMIVVKTPRPATNGKVLGIRRVNLAVSDTLPSGELHEKRVPYVEVELEVGEPDFNTSLFHLVQIGDREFMVFEWNQVGDRHTATVRMPAAEFEALADGSEIFYRVGEPIENEQFAKLRAAGKLPADRLSAGKLSKRMIELEATVEKSAVVKP